MAVNFVPHPEIAPCKSVYDATLLELRKKLGLSHKLQGDDIQELTKHPDFPYKSWYKFRYEDIFRDIAGGEDHDREARAKGAQRMLIAKDLFYIVAFVMEVPLDLCNNPYVIDSCRELEESTPDGGLSATDILDIESREHFKAIDLLEPVFTTKGWKNHGDLVAGDRVFGPDGQPCKVVGKTEVFNEADCYRVTFDDGYSVVCSGDHLWEVTRSGKTRVTTTREIATHEHLPDGRFSVNVNQPIQFPTANLTVDPYVMGAWLGDGHSASARFTCSNTDYPSFEKHFKAAGHNLQFAAKKDNCLTVAFDTDRSKICLNGHNMGEVGYYENKGIKRCAGCKNKKPTTEPKPKSLGLELKKLGLLYDNEKHIPRAFFKGSVEQRLALLQGMMDTDGTVDTRGTATFCNINERLIDDFTELATGLGLKPRRRQHKSTVNGLPYIFFQVSFQAYTIFPVFRLERKLVKCKDGIRKAKRFIKSCVAVEPIPVSCIQVDRPDGLYLIGKNMVTTHNSTIRTVALTIKRVINDPDCCTFIFSYKKDAAAKFLTAIKETFERPLLIWAFPEIFYSNPGYESPSWSLQNGIVVKRKSASRREKTVEAFGLVEGMPIGGHADHRIYDDVETFDIAKSADQMNLCFNSFEMSFSLGRQGGTELIHGTYYHFHGPLIRIRDKKKLDGTPVYRLIIKPCTHDGTRTGKPVLFSPEYLQACIEKSGKNFDSQYLCNPAPVDTITLDKSMLNRIEPAFLRTGKWADRYKFLVVDQAGGTDTNVGGPGDLWAIGVVSICPSDSLAKRNGDEATDDDLGISDVCVEDLVADRLTHSQAIDTIVRMYLKHGMIMQVGVEKVSLSTTEIHVVDALAAKGRKLSVQHGNLFLLRPAGRKLENRISSALEWPLNNGNLYYSTGIAPDYIDKMKQEMDQFGFGHSDILNIVSYGYDMFRVFPFHRYAKRKVVSVTALMAQGSGASGRVKGEWG